tara:strand:- start:224 stop:478 length:255 start_codon:yes stop_codon:yes gene_type:complete
MAKPEHQLRKEITDMFVFEYLPRLKDEVARFNAESLPKHLTAIEVSKMCGRSIGIELGELKIAEPTNDLIDKLVTYVERVQSDK